MTGERAQTSGSVATVYGSPATVPVVTEPVSVDAPSTGANWPDESAESAFIAEARERGETVTVKKVEAEPAAEVEARTPLPPLDELVNRIPPEAREALEDLFRARFVTVKRVPKRALK